MGIRRRTIAELATMICGDIDLFRYHTRSDLYDFLHDCQLQNFTNEASTRHNLVEATLRDLLFA